MNQSLYDLLLIYDVEVGKMIKLKCKKFAFE